MDLMKLFRRSPKPQNGHAKPLNGHAKEVADDNLEGAILQMKGLESKYDNVIDLSERLRQKACHAK